MKAVIASNSKTHIIKKKVDEKEKVRHFYSLPSKCKDIYNFLTVWIYIDSWLLLLDTWPFQMFALYMSSRCPNVSLQKLPEQWLWNVLEEIKCSDASSKLCATRRSAGIPFYIQVFLYGIKAGVFFVCFWSFDSSIF